MKRIIFKFLTLLILFGFVSLPETNSYLSDLESSVNNTFAAGCWSPPSTPVLISPVENSNLKDSSVVFDWSDSFVCPGETLSYLISINNNEAIEIFASEYVFTPPADGVYSWKVKAKDTQGKESSWSDEWVLISDQTPPETILKVGSKIINEKVNNGGFEAGLTGWNTLGKVILVNGYDGFASPYDGTRMVRIGHRTAITGNEVWDNRLRQRIESGAKNLSFYYNFFSYDAGPFDNPGFEVRINDYNVFYLSAEDINNGLSPNSTGWRQLNFDISGINEPVLEIIFYSGNTDGNTVQSWVYIDNISTAEAVVHKDQELILEASDNLSGVAKIQYNYGTGWLDYSDGFNLSDMPTDSGLVYFRSWDKADNVGFEESRYLTKDSLPPDNILALTANPFSKHEIQLLWQAPSGNPSVYDLRYNLDQILTEADFLSATPAANLPAPRPAGVEHEFILGGLNTGTHYYFALKSADSALNWSNFTTAEATTMTDVEDPDVNPGDVVINELMWMGTSYSTADEYLELRNMTDKTISLSKWQVAGVTIPDGKTIAPHGYFLITNFSQAKSKINVKPDYVDSNLSLPNSNKQYLLTNSLGEVIDVADNGIGAPAAGAFNPDLKRYWSMERDNNPGDGSREDVWHTCLADVSAISAYWDDGDLAFEKGTPRGPNLSQTDSTEVQLFFKNDRFSFSAINVSQFNQLNYVLTYDSDSGTQGISGTIDINGRNIVEVENLIPGSCSGETCIYHQGIKSVKLEIDLTGLIKRVITKTL